MRKFKKLKAAWIQEEYRIWARSYAKHKGDSPKLSEIRDILRKLKTRLLEISDFRHH